MGQRFIAREPFHFPNGAIGWAPGGSFDDLGPYAKVQQCPVRKYEYPGKPWDDPVVTEYGRYTCYASAYPDTSFSIPANTRIKGVHVKGYFCLDEGNIEFRVTTGQTK